MQNKFLITCVVTLTMFLASCGDNSEANSVIPTDETITLTDDIHAPTYVGAERNFSSSFDLESDFDGFYIVPQGDYDTNHTLSTDEINDTTFAHKAWILQARDIDNESTPTYLPHRGYPTVQLDKTADGIYRKSLVSLMVYLDMNLTARAGIDDWFSFITLSPDSSDSWSRTVLVNVAPDGYARLVHVPNQGEQTYIYQEENNISMKFPFRQWVRFDVYIDFDETNGYAKVWQDGVLVSHANVNGGLGGLAQAHFGMYAAAAVEAGTIYNDKLRIQEVADEAAAQDLVDAAY